MVGSTPTCHQSWLSSAANHADRSSVRNRSENQSVGTELERPGGGDDDLCDVSRSWLGRQFGVALVMSLLSRFVALSSREVQCDN
jgi:hypothetical protein